MKKNLQEAEYKEITGLDIKGQLLENSGTPEDRGDGKPFLMHKLRVMIGPYQKDIPITNQELRKIMFIQENKKMTLKERIRKELINVVQEGGAEMMGQYQIDAQADKQPARVDALRDLLDEFDMNDLKSALVDRGAKEAKVDALYRALTDVMGLQKKDDTPISLKEMIKEELEKVLDEINMPFDVIEKIKNLDDNIERMMAKRDAMAVEHGEKARYAGMVDEGKSFTDGLPRLQGTAKEIDDLIGAAIDAHMAADRFAEKGATDFATHMDRAVGVALGDIEPLLAKMNRIAIEKTMPHLAAAKSSAGEERLKALGKAKDALVPR